MAGPANGSFRLINQIAPCGMGRRVRGGPCRVGVC
jgi:hypothetical protein